MIACNPVAIEQHFVGTDDPGNKVYVGPLVLLRDHLQVTILNPDNSTSILQEGVHFDVELFGGDLVSSQIRLTTAGEDLIRSTGVYGVSSGASTITLLRVMDICQLNDYIENGAFPAETTEYSLDYLTLLVSSLQRLARSSGIRFPENELTIDDDPVNGINNVTPDVAGRADQFLKFDALGNVVVGLPASVNVVIVNDDNMGSGGGSVSDPPSVSSVYNFVTNLLNPALDPTAVSRSITATLEDYVPQWDSSNGVLKLGKFIYLSIADAIAEANGRGLLDSRVVATFLESTRIVLGLDDDGNWTDPSTGTGPFQCSSFRSQDVNEQQTITSIEPAFTDNNPSWPTPGFTFQFEYNGVQSSVIQSDEDVTAIQTALETIPALTGNINVTAVAVAPNPVWTTGGAEVLTVEFINALANTNVSLLSIVNYAKEPSAPATLTEPAFTIVQTVEGHKTSWTEAFCDLHDKHDQLRIDHDALQAEVDTTQAGAGLNPDGTYTPDPDCAFLAGATSIQEALCNLNNEIDCNRNGLLEHEETLNPSDPNAGAPWDFTFVPQSLYTVGGTSPINTTVAVDLENYGVPTEAKSALIRLYAYQATRGYQSRVSTKITGQTRAKAFSQLWTDDYINYDDEDQAEFWVDIRSSKIINIQVEGNFVIKGNVPRINQITHEAHLIAYK